MPPVVAVRVSGATSSIRRTACQRGDHQTVLPYSWWPIIFGVAMNRQRVLRSVGAALLTLGALAGGTACGADNSLQAAQTAVTAAQTVMPGAQATAQAGATLVSNVVSTAQPVILMLQGLLQGASLNVTTMPDGAQPGDVTAVSIDGTDNQGRLGQIDQQTRQTAVAAALVAVGQYYPKATVTLKVVDGSGDTLVTGSVAPGEAPSVQ
jgi:hypothetical protein